MVFIQGRGGTSALIDRRSSIGIVASAINGRAGDLVKRSLRVLLCVVFLNPFAVVAAIVVGWVLMHFVAGLHNSLNGHHTWCVCDAVGCCACLGAMTLLVMLATGSVILTAIIGWRGPEEPAVDKN